MDTEESDRLSQSTATDYTGIAGACASMLNGYSYIIGGYRTNRVSEIMTWNLGSKWSWTIEIWDCFENLSFSLKSVDDLMFDTTCFEI